jgi:hypothetical protein
LRFLASHGVFREVGNGEFDHSALSRVLRSDADGSYRAAGRLFHHSFADWDGLDHAVRTGEPGFREKYGASLFDYLGAHPELAPVFDAGMTCIHRYETAAMLEAYSSIIRTCAASCSTWTTW